MPQTKTKPADQLDLERETVSNGKGLWAKILKAQSSIHEIRSDKMHDTFKYKYASKQIILGTIRTVLHDNDLLILTNMKSCKRERMDVPDKEGQPVPHLFVEVIMEFTLIDPDNGDQWKCTFTGYANDKLTIAETTPQKAETSALRTFYMDFFQIPVLEGENEKSGPASQKQKDYINRLYKEIKPSQEAWGKMLNMSASMYSADKDEFKAWERQYLDELTSTRASKIINILLQMKEPKKNGS